MLAVASVIESVIGFLIRRSEVRSLPGAVIRSACQQRGCLLRTVLASLSTEGFLGLRRRQHLQCRLRWIKHGAHENRCPARQPRELSAHCVETRNRNGESGVRVDHLTLAGEHLVRGLQTVRTGKEREAGLAAVVPGVQLLALHRSGQRTTGRRWRSGLLAVGQNQQETRPQCAKQQTVSHWRFTVSMISSRIKADAKDAGAF